MEFGEKIMVMDALIAGADPKLLKVISQLSATVTEAVSGDPNAMGQKSDAEQVLDFLQILPKLMQAFMNLPTQLSKEEMGQVKQNIQRMLDLSPDAEKWHKTSEIFAQMRALQEEHSNIWE